MKYAWMDGTTIREVAQGIPAELYHSSIAVHFTASVPDDAEEGDSWNGSVLTKKVVPEPIQQETTYKRLSPIEFKLLFTGLERIAIRAAKETDPLIADFYDIIDDPRITGIELGLQSTQDGIAYLALIGLIEPDRVAEILSGSIK